MHRPPGNVCCRFFNSPAPSHRTPLWFRSNSARSTTACSIETWSSYVTASIRRHLACPMDAASRSPSGPLVAFLLRRKWEKYRDSLVTPLDTQRLFTGQLTGEPLIHLQTGHHCTSSPGIAHLGHAHPILCFVP